MKSLKYKPLKYIRKNLAEDIYSTEKITTQLRDVMKEEKGRN
jgi:hypothetical protein